MQSWQDDDRPDDKIVGTRIVQNRPKIRKFSNVGENFWEMMKNGRKT